MSNRIKRVFAGADQVIHLWANQAQDSARCKNVFFEGKSIYSYGHHYELGRLVEYKGVTWAIINTKGYSVTTRKHIAYALDAVRHLPNLSCPGTEFNVVKALKHQRADLLDQFKAEFRRRKFYGDSLILSACLFEASGIGRDIGRHNKYCTLAKQPRLKIKLSAKQIKAYNDYVASRIARQSELQEARRDSLRRQAIEDLVSWRQGGPLTQAVRSLEPQLIRVNGDRVETTRGAYVPLAEAVTLLRHILGGEAKPGTPIGSFSLDKVGQGLITIGCHNIDVAEAQSVLGPHMLRLVS